MYSRMTLTCWVVLLCLILPTTNAMPLAPRSNTNAAAAAADAVADAVAAVGAAVAARSGNLPRGSDSYPNMVKYWGFLPGMKRWNGRPFYDFVRIWWVALVL